MKITNIKPIHRKNQIASFDLEMNSFIIECQLMSGKGGGHFVSYPSRQYQDSSGQTKFWAMCKWKDKETADRAKDWIVKQLAEQMPSLFKQQPNHHDDLDDSTLPF